MSDSETMRRALLTLALALALPAMIWAQSASLTIDAPGTVVEGALTKVTVHYTSNIDETNHRGVIILDVLDASDLSLIERLDNDNGLAGFEGPSGSADFTFTLSEPAPDAICFRAFMTPYGINDELQALMDTYPDDGTYPYEWSGGYGTTQDLYYLGTRFITNTTGNTTYCCGITFEVFLLCYENHLEAQGLDPHIGGMSLSQIGAFRRLWYGVTDYEHQCTLAIERYGLGVVLTDIEDARPGDHVQFWRTRETGHSCIFQGWTHSDGKIDRLIFWSSQSSTNGIGVFSEKVRESGGIDPDRIYIARVMRPRGPDDWDLRFGDTDTISSPTPVVEGMAHGFLLH